MDGESPYHLLHQAPAPLTLSVYNVSDPECVCVYLLAEPTAALFVKITGSIVFLPFVEKAVKDVRGGGWHQSVAHSDNEHREEG